MLIETLYLGKKTNLSAKIIPGISLVVTTMWKLDDNLLPLSSSSIVNDIDINILSLNKFNIIFVRQEFYIVKGRPFIKTTKYQVDKFGSIIKILNFPNHDIVKYNVGEGEILIRGLDDDLLIQLVTY